MIDLKKIVVFLLFMCIQKAVICYSAEFSPEKAGFSVRFQSEISPYKVTGVFLLPEERMELEVIEKGSKGTYLIEADSGILAQIGQNRWHWTAPDIHGLYPVKIISSDKSDSITLNVFVMIPYKDLKGDSLNGYRIGKYPQMPLKNLPIYKPPRGFIEVTRENEDTLVSPHFRLKQFISKQPAGYPKYVVLRERLLFKLELILEKVNEKGYRTDTFHVMSGYRTPYYNKAIGNVKYSRHVWGGAADIYIDEDPRDEMMDDLNRDGKIDYRDAEIIHDIVDELYGKPFYESFIGGLGWYRKTANHGPFVHVDVRGFRARWGD